ncbi:hypothetical protein [Roseivirga sp. E12]|uniref:hypothetical protein n=1 Tax=Roseivirga sp. E12 TaxID=2819237 RepID=UPI001ABC3393|nr:hypothetical protein [Roseivirga sp. E12]MBO3698015.1 hypothetical protein [Roseivirga sp. E12]
MRRLSIILICCVTLNLTSWSQLAGTPPNGAVSIGLGGISSIDHKEWSIFNNPAGLSNVGQVSGIIGYQTTLSFLPFNSVMAGVSSPLKSSVLGFGISKFGDEIFNTQMAYMGFAHKVGNTKAGIKTNILQLQIDGFGKQSVFISEIGVLANLSPEFTLGTYIYNFTQSSISTDIQEKVPVIIRLSIDYHPSDQLNIYSEIEKDVVLDPDLRFGLAYKLVERLIVRTGISTSVKRHSFGASLISNRFTIDYGVRSGRETGVLHSFGLKYLFKR